MKPRRSRLQFSLKWLMATVLVLALGLEAMRLFRLSQYYHARAEFFGQAAREFERIVRTFEAKESRFRRMAGSYEQGRVPAEEAAAYRRGVDRDTALREAAICEEQADECKVIVERRKISLAYYRSCFNKYATAARFPWRVVAPDPPAPGL